MTSFEQFQQAFKNNDKISSKQWELIEKMSALHRDWNGKINLVSRKDIDNLEWHHYAPCLSVLNILTLMNGAQIIDVGTGGGFPGLLLAVLYPNAHFTLMDSIAKKIVVVQDIAEQLKLSNVEVKIGRVEKLNRSFDFITGRAVTNLPEFFSLTKRLIRPGMKNSLSNGILYWKGGSLEEEIKNLGLSPDQVFSLEESLKDEYFYEKYILHFSYKTIFSKKIYRR